MIKFLVYAHENIQRNSANDFSIKLSHTMQHGPVYFFKIFSKQYIHVYISK